MNWDKVFVFSAIAAFAAVSAFGDIYLAGDSTMCNYRDSQYPQQGWGQALSIFMKDADKLHNRAIGGRSARSFRAEGRWASLIRDLQPGDWVIVAFGHNDANKQKKDRYSSKEDYKELMRGFASDVKGKGANIVFATSIPHSGGFTSSGEDQLSVRGSASGLGPYVAATCELGEELGIPVLDLNRYACENLPKIGFAKAKKLYMRIEPGEYDSYPNGKSDGCHIRDTGAYYYASAAVEMAREKNLGICELFKAPEEVVFTPIPKEGPRARYTPMKDDFSQEEIPYANEGAEDWRKEIMNLRREAQKNGMGKEEAQRWAAQEYRRRHKENSK